MDIQNNFSWSKSRASTFADCHYRYYLHYYGYWGGWQFDAPPRKQRLYVLRRLSSIPQWSGIAVHETIATYLKIFRSGTKPDLDELIAAARDQMRADYRNSKTGGYWRVPKSFGLAEHEYDDPVPAERYKENWAMVEQCLRNFACSPILADIERSDPNRFKPIDALDSFELDDVSVWAAPDFAYERHNGRLIIVDWKTGKPREDDRFQIAGYADFAERRWGYPPGHVLGALVYLRTGDVDKVVLDRDEIDSFERRARSSMGQMRQMLVDPERNIADESGFPKTTDTSRCHHCNFRIECWPAGRVPQS